MVKEKLLEIIKDERITLFFILLLALALRLANLGAEPFWGDEALSLDIVRHYAGDMSGMLRYLKEVEVHPPLYYLMLKFWTIWFGYTETAVRSLSVIFGLGVVGLAYYAGKVIYPGTKFALIAAFLTAILPMQIEFSQEARPYIIFCFFGLLSVLSLWRYLETGAKRQLAVFIIASIIGVNLHYSYFLVLATVFGWWLLRLIVEKKYAQREMAVFLGSIAAVFLGFYHWLTAFLYKLALTAQTLPLANVFEGGTDRMITTNRNFSYFEGTINQLIWLTNAKSIHSIEIFAMIVFKLAFIGLLAYGLYRKKEQLAGYLRTEGKKAVFFIWLAVVPIVLYLFAPQSYQYSNMVEKHIILSSVMLAFVISSVIIRLPAKLMSLTLALFFISTVNFNVTIMGNDAVWNPDHKLKEIAEYINLNYQDEDMVLVYFGFGRTDFNHFLRSEISSVAIYPVYPLDWQDDYLASRETIGFMENESQSRIFKINERETDLKINHLVGKYQPRRVWVFTDDKLTNHWFLKNNWRHAMKSMGDLFSLNLYVKQ